jgi:hypothetical protein
MMMRRFSILVLALAAAMCGHDAHAQLAKRAALQSVDPDFGDVGPLRVSTRVLPVDMRSPSGFDRVYRVPGSAGGVPGMDGGEERFARISGGLAAVFPRSDYITTKKGQYALIPPGTVFYIGGVPTPSAIVGARPAPARGGAYSLSAAARELPSMSAASGMVDLRVPEGQEIAPPVTLRPDAAAPPQNVLADDQYRRARMRHLLWAAAHAE